MKLTPFFIFGMLIISSYAFAETVHFTGVVSTNSWVQFAGRLSINNLDPENGADEVAVFVSDGNGGELMVGATTVGSTVNNYYLVSVYGDDTQTIQKDGALVGDDLIFKVWHSQSNTEQALAQDQINAEVASGLILPELPAVFTSVHGEQYGYLHLQFLPESSENPIKKVAIPAHSTIGLFFWMSLLIMISIYSLRSKQSVLH
ncbi:MAG: hypothetical protein HQK75_02280 [Candidatus Magnetomorum sp.]|nr:hypothetical protein [Candidatus Magnetomorum sp.]